MLIGAECDRHAGLHLSFENLLVEVLDDNGRPTPAGEDGNIVVTDLTNLGMPFIRYVTGDRAVAGFTQCSCGRGLLMLRKVVGRRLDIIDTPDGRRIPGEFFPHLIKDYPGIERFQVVQNTLDRVELRLVVSAAWNNAQELQLRDAVKAVLGEAIRLEVMYTPTIDLTALGKLRVVVNNVAAQQNIRDS